MQSGQTILRIEALAVTAVSPWARMGSPQNLRYGATRYSALAVSERKQICPIFALPQSRRYQRLARRWIVRVQLSDFS
ncbi:hypothetical protein PCAR4_290037 [Paraburkholderia caribensis]|nr:hypothetical protein PCAR4_290037 [Paraburkholderia caribensis]